MVPFDVFDLVVRQNGADPVEKEIALDGQGHVQHHQLASEDLVLAAQRPVRVRAEDVAVRVDHFRLEPDSEFHALRADMPDERGKAVGVFSRVHLPVRKCPRIVVPAAEPAIIQHEPFGSETGGTGCDLLQLRQVVVEIDRFPAIEMNRTGTDWIREMHNPVPEVTLKRDRTTVDSVI